MDDEHTKALHMLAKSGPKMPQKPRSTEPDYDFEHLGSTLADSLSQMAEDITMEANQVAEKARLLAAEIRAKIAEQSRELTDSNIRLKAAGEHVLEAQRKFSGT
jgi:hypothetical protein